MNAAPAHHPTAAPTTVQDRFLRAIRRQGPDRVPVVSCISSQYICRKAGVGVKDYLFDPRISWTRSARSRTSTPR